MAFQHLKTKPFGAFFVMCTQPISRKNNGFDAYKTPVHHVPCGKCPTCVKSKTRDLIFRVSQHLKVSSNPLFVTLTYNDENLPLLENGLPTLKKDDVQKFLKRLRFHYEKISDKKISYKLVGEYGKLRGRPHYHLIMFNLDAPHLIPLAWTNPETGQSMGFTEYPPLNHSYYNAGVSYLVKYLSKKRGYNKNGQLREFSNSSKGLGENYLTREIVKFHTQDLQNCYVVLDGRKMPMPKYYKEKLYSSSNGERAKVTEILKNRHEEGVAKQILQRWQNNPRATIEEIKKDLDLSKLHTTFDKVNHKL